MEFLEHPPAYLVILNSFHLSNRYIRVLCLLLFVGIVVWTAPLTYLDYHAFLALGPGGTPSTVLGYGKLKLLALFRLRDPLSAPAIPPDLLNKCGYLSTRTLRHRVGPRPGVVGLAPHRQVDSFATTQSYEQVTAAIEELASNTPGLAMALSFFEKHNDALIVVDPMHNRDRGGEVCHVHHVDGSLHMTLHPADVALSIERGWAERHPLARGGWMNRFVSETFVMIYAPRTDLEVQTVMDLVRAGVWWVGGENLLALETWSDTRADPSFARRGL